MTVTLRHFDEAQERLLRDTFDKLAGLERLGGWYIDKATINRKSATLYLKWDNDVSPMDNQSLQTIFDRSPEFLFCVLGQLLDAPGWAEKPDTEAGR